MESQLKQPVDPEDDIFIQTLQLKKQHRKKIRMEKNSLTMEKLIAQCRLSATDAMAMDRYWEQQSVSMLDEDINAILRLRVQRHHAKPTQPNMYALAICPCLVP